MTLSLDDARAAAGAPDFTQVFTDPPEGDGPLGGLTVAVKDLFDVAGYRTRAGSRARDDAPPATHDAVAVARLRAAGAGLIGHTTMTEFAYSGLGLNPHDGVPMSPLREGAIAGGSTSGGASAVARGVADIALGTDTGGSVRIPAAFCGLWGFKPTASDVPQAGAASLSYTLDSVGAMAADLGTLELAMSVLRGAPYPEAEATERYLVPETFGLNDLDQDVASAFEMALGDLILGGLAIEREADPFFTRYGAFSAGTVTAVESRVHHAGAWETARDLIDPRVAARMAKADGISAIDYAAALVERAGLEAGFTGVLAGRLVLLPTVAILPPSLADLEDDAAFDRTNLLALRNTSLANVTGGCAITIPLTGTPGAGLMIVGPAGADAQVFAAAKRIGPVLRPN